MSTSPGGWSCEISLRFDYDESGTRLSASRTETFCPCMTDKESMDIWLRRAQAAILSPHLPYQSFFSKSVEDLRSAMRTDTRMLKFSRNTICLDIMDPDATVLSFVDLPGEEHHHSSSMTLVLILYQGLIQNEAPNVIELVKGLVEDKIGGENSENTLILITIPMSGGSSPAHEVRSQS
jgi:vacuolar protein sorting-associated protein 1